MAKIIGKGTGTTTWGTHLNDTIYVKGSAGAYGQGGNDYLYGDGAANMLSGGDGNDHAFGGGGNDALFGGNGSDTLYGESGDDMMWGGAGNDQLYGGNGDDKLRGEAGNDYLHGGLGNNELKGGDGNDRLVFQSAGLVKESHSLFFGDAGYDTLEVKSPGAEVNVSIDPVSGLGSVYVNGAMVVEAFSGIEAVVISSDARIDYSGSPVPSAAVDISVTGGTGEDRFFSGAGNETFNGKGGNDAFFFNSTNSDIDRLVGFNAAEDVIVTTLWEDSQGNPISTRTISENNGETTVLTTADNGEVVHTMIIDQVGIPLSVFKDGFAFG